MTLEQVSLGTPMYSDESEIEDVVTERVIIFNPLLDFVITSPSATVFRYTNGLVDNELVASGSTPSPDLAPIPLVPTGLSTVFGDLFQLNQNNFGDDLFNSFGLSRAFAVVFTFNKYDAFLWYKGDDVLEQGVTATLSEDLFELNNVTATDLF